MPSFAFSRQPESVAAAWFSSRAGQVLLESEQDVLQVALSQRAGLASLWLGPQAALAPTDVDGLPLLRLSSDAWPLLQGDVRCTLPLPLATESCATVIVQHVEIQGSASQQLLDECARVLIPGGRLWLLALNPFAPYRLRWRGSGLGAREPVTWRRRLRGAGLLPDSLTRGLGPSWAELPDGRLQDGVGLRAAYLLRAEKRQLPLTPMRARPLLRWAPGGAA